MAALYEGYTLCGLNPDLTRSTSGVQGVEEERDTDHVIVTASTRTVTLFKVSDQKPLGSWTMKEGQTLTCPAVYNSKTKEIVAVTDNRVIKIWKEEDMTLDKTFKATVSSDIWKIHCVPDGEPLVLFRTGAVRLLEPLLAAPQQPIESVLGEDEAIRWSSSIASESQQFVTFLTEMKGENFFYLHRLNPNSLQKYQLEKEEPNLSPLSVCASCKDDHIAVVFFYPNGSAYRSVISVRGPAVDARSQTLPLPRSLMLTLPVGHDRLESAAAVLLDESHMAVVGAPHPSAGAGKDFLCIWNTNFQTLQAGKEMSGKIYGQKPLLLLLDGDVKRQVSLFSQLLSAGGGLYDFGRLSRLLSTLWGFSNKLFIPHGKSLSVIPFACQKSSLASALGKLRQARPVESKCPAPVPSWNSILHGEKAPPSRTVETRKTKSSKSQTVSTQGVDQVLELIKAAPANEVQKELAKLLTRKDPQDLQTQMGQLATALVSRSLSDPTFYTPSSLVQLVHSQCLCHSVCPNLLPLALEKKDYFLCQLCLMFFPDIPEGITCACLKAFICLPDAEAEKLSLEPESVSFIETLISQEVRQDEPQNGVSLTLTSQEDLPSLVSGEESIQSNKNFTAAQEQEQEQACPVESHKAALLNEILQSAYSDTFLLPHLKDFSSDQVLLFLRYLNFLYLRYSQDTFPQTHSFRAPSMNQIMDWVCMVLDAHFTVLVMTPEAKGLLLNLHNFVRSQVKLFSELGKIEGSLQELQKMKTTKDVGQYSIEVIELF